MVTDSELIVLRCICICKDGLLWY